MKRIDLTNKTFGDLTVLSYAGNKRWLCRCSCGKELTVFARSLLHDGKTSCGHLTLEQRLSKMQYNLLGMHFGEWEVLKFLGNQMWLCRCSCGTLRKISSQHLRYGQTKSCGHSTTKFKDLTGQHFGEWEAQKYLGNQTWLCKCSCGITRGVKTNDLISGKSKSCGHATTGFKDLTGQTIGAWEVLYYCGAGMYWCRCSCGVEQYVSGKSLRAGTSRSCGHGNPLDLTGQTFWEWTALKYVGNHLWRCQCSCGTIRDIPSLRLRSGVTKSCGCKKEENFRNTINAKYGIRNISQLHLTPEQLYMTSSRENLKNAILMNFLTNPTPKELSELLGITPAQVMRNIRKFDLEDLVVLNKPVSTYENEIAELFPCTHRSDRTLLNGKEIDLYYPESNFAIEFNGDYWHSSQKKPKTYHQVKSILAGKKGVHLVHIFEHEWNNLYSRKKLIDLIDRNINQSKLTRIGARECTIKPITYQECKVFLDLYHLQRSLTSKVYLGCYYHGELVGVITFGTPRFTSDCEYELTRLAWKSGTIVNGGSEKLLKYFISNYHPSSIVTYCDLSKFNGNSYLRLGFKFDKLTDPNYCWVDSYNLEVISRYRTTKQKLIESGLGTPDQTENEIMEAAGYLKVYDCGNLKFVWNNPNMEVG